MELEALLVKGVYTEHEIYSKLFESNMLKFYREDLDSSILIIELYSISAILDAKNITNLSSLVDEIKLKNLDKL